MRPSIRSRIIWAMNVLVVGVGGVVGWFGVQLTGDLTERRLVEQAASNAAALIQELPLPVSRDLLLRFRQILGSEVAVVARGTVTASLPDEQVPALSRQLERDELPRHVTLDGRLYRLGTAVIGVGDGRTSSERPMTLYLLAPESALRQAKRQAALRMITVTLVAVVGATILAVWLSSTIAAPVLRLSQRIDQLSGQMAGGKTPPALRAAAPVNARAVGASSERRSAHASPVEIQRLEAAYDRLLDQLTQARGELARSAQLAALGQLAASVAHELRNPLSGIKMNAKILADEFKARNASDPSLELIIREVERMDLFLGELLDLGKTREADASGTGQEALRSKADLAQVAESVVDLLRGRCRHAGVGIDVDVNSGARHVRGDPGALRQVILNLVLNALAALPEGGAIALRTCRGTGGVRFAVSDNGEGVRLPAGEDPFAAFVTSKDRSSGLGLYICRQIIERHAGQLGYDTGDAGATFWFELPDAEAGAAKRPDERGMERGQQ